MTVTLCPNSNGDHAFMILDITNFRITAKEIELQHNRPVDIPNPPSKFDTWAFLGPEFMQGNITLHMEVSS